MNTVLRKSTNEAGHCYLCGWPIVGAWVRHGGPRVHPACWAATGDQPDIIRGIEPKDED